MSDLYRRPSRVKHALWFLIHSLSPVLLALLIVAAYVALLGVLR